MRPSRIRSARERFGASGLFVVVAGHVGEVEVPAPCVRGWDCSCDTRAGVACIMTGATASIGHCVR
jgi:hypothetical protein